VRLYPVLGRAEDLRRVLAEREVHGQLIDRIVVTTRFEDLSTAAQEALLQVERTSSIQLDFFAERVVLNREPARNPRRLEAGGRDDRSAAAAELSRLDLSALASKPYFRWKRVLDMVAAGVAIVCLAPFAVLLCFVILCVAGPPPIFWQQRPGSHGRPFKLYKFRTMRGAHDRLGRRLTDAERLSRIGRLMRRFRFDELPQLYNILVGEMSFVGPRPLLPVDQSPAFAARLAARPGLTGWAQIKGGRELSASDKAALDIWYVRNASFGLDMKILLGTLGVILFGERTDREAIRQAWRALGDVRPEQQRPASRAGEAPLVPESSSGDYQAVLRVTVPQVPSARAHPSAGSRA
jgi:lipopolysaccharide/colanic/teichoic acid biosynthesis glycosyltransferase